MFSPNEANNTIIPLLIAGFSSICIDVLLKIDNDKTNTTIRRQEPFQVKAQQKRALVVRDRILCQCVIFLALTLIDVKKITAELKVAEQDSTTSSTHDAPVSSLSVVESCLGFSIYITIFLSLLKTFFLSKMCFGCSINNNNKNRLQVKSPVSVFSSITSHIILSSVPAIYYTSTIITLSFIYLVNHNDQQESTGSKTDKNNDIYDSMVIEYQKKVNVNFVVIFSIMFLYQVLKTVLISSQNNNSNNDYPTHVNDNRSILSFSFDNFHVPSPFSFFGGGVLESNDMMLNPQHVTADGLHDTINNNGYINDHDRYNFVSSGNSNPSIILRHEDWYGWSAQTFMQWVSCDVFSPSYFKQNNHHDNGISKLSSPGQEEIYTQNYILHTLEKHNFDGKCLPHITISHLILLLITSSDTESCSLTFGQVVHLYQSIQKLMKTYPFPSSSASFLSSSNHNTLSTHSSTKNDHNVDILDLLEDGNGKTGTNEVADGDATTEEKLEQFRNMMKEKYGFNIPELQKQQQQKQKQMDKDYGLHTEQKQKLKQKRLSTISEDDRDDSDDNEENDNAGNSDNSPLPFYNSDNNSMPPQIQEIANKNPDLFQQILQQKYPQLTSRRRGLVAPTITTAAANANNTNGQDKEDENKPLIKKSN